MDKLDKFQRAQVRSLLEDSRFNHIEALKKIVMAEISAYEVKAPDEFNTIWRTAQREAGVQVLEDFFKRLIFEASKSDED